MTDRCFVAEEPHKRVDVFLCGETELTRSAVKKLIDEGNVTVNGETVKAGREIRAGDVISLSLPEPKELSVRPENIPLDIVWQDEDIAVVNKPQGMTVHMGNGNTDGTLVNALLYHLDSLSGINGVIRQGHFRAFGGRKERQGARLALPTDRGKDLPQDVLRPIGGTRQGG